MATFGYLHDIAFYTIDALEPGSEVFTAVAEEAYHRARLSEGSEIEMGCRGDAR